MSSHAPGKNVHPSEHLREVPLLLRKQWKQFVGTPATALRWSLAHDEPEWVETFLESPMDGVTRVFVIEDAADSVDGYGFTAGRTLLSQLGKARIGKQPAWVCPAIPERARDTDALARIAASFAQHITGAGLKELALVLAPERIRDERAWLAWVEGFVVAASGHAKNVRVVLLDDVRRPRYDGLALALGPAMHTEVAGLAVSERIARMTEAAADQTCPEGQLRVLTVRAMQQVNAGQIDEADRLASAVESLASSAGKHGAVVPVRFAVGSGLIQAGRHDDAAKSYRAAELASERAEAAGDANGLWLRVTARFGVGAALLAAPHGAAQAARYYEDTAPLCKKLGDARLELEANRCASVAHELAHAYKPAWATAAKALDVVDRLTIDERENAMLVPLVDAMLRLTEARELRHFRSAIEGELRKRKLRGTQWA